MTVAVAIEEACINTFISEKIRHTKAPFHVIFLPLYFSTISPYCQFVFRKKRLTSDASSTIMCTQAIIFKENTMRSIPDIPYKDGLMLDLYLPDEGAFDLFVRFHGGGPSRSI